ncbi:unnamed protein product [Trichobilharzia szidati]|nr:unnamed protein product [Trichobilharzia szidati]
MLVILPKLLILFALYNGHCVLSNVCTSQINTSIFNCSGRHLTEIPGFIHESVAELDLSYNLLEILHEDSFTRLRNIRKLILAYNRIYKITERAFLPIADTLIWLDLRFNQLTSSIHAPFPVTAFSQLIHVEYLDLSGNALGFLPARFLYHVGASLNRLEMSSIPKRIHLERDTFYGLNQLHYLNLANNTFANLMEDALRGLRPEHFSYFNLDGVKWICDCQIVWFRRWLSRLPKKATQFSLKPGGECGSPGQYQNIPLIVDEYYTIMSSTSSSSSYRHHLLKSNSNLTDHATPIDVYGFQDHNLTLVCSFISEPKMQIQWFHNGVLIQPHWSRVIQTISPGIKFITTLYFEHLDKTRDEGEYKCQTSNHKGYASATFHVHVQKSNEQINEFKLFDDDDKNNNFHKNSQFNNNLFNPIIITICIILFNVTFIIIGLCILKCVYNKRAHSRNHRKNRLIKTTKDNIEHLNDNYTKSITSNYTPVIDNISQVNVLNNLDNNNNTEIASDLLPMLSHLPDENLAQLQINHITQYTNNKLSNINDLNIDNIPNNNNDNNSFKYTLQTKLTHYSMKQETPSPQSSDMGYLTSNASQNCDSLTEQYNNSNSNHLDSAVSIKSVKPKSYYKLGIRSRSHSPELIYFPANNTNSAVIMPQTTYSLFSSPTTPERLTYNTLEANLPEQPTTSKYQYDKCDTIILGECNKLITSENLSCPIHGLSSVNDENDLLSTDKSCKRHSIKTQNMSKCPIHGDKKTLQSCNKFDGNRNKINPRKSSVKYSSLRMDYCNRSLMESMKMTTLNGQRRSMRNLLNNNIDNNN